VSQQSHMSPRRKQFIVGIIVGLIVGIGVALLTQFWLWVPAGIATGIAAGIIMKPPQENNDKSSKRK
jgi:hypothetical protein